MGNRPSRGGHGGSPREGTTRVCFVRPRGAIIAYEGSATGPTTQRTDPPGLQYGCSIGLRGHRQPSSPRRQNIAFCGGFFGGPAWTRTRDLFLISSVRPSRRRVRRVRPVRKTAYIGPKPPTQGVSRFRCVRRIRRGCSTVAVEGTWPEPPSGPRRGRPCRTRTRPYPCPVAALPLLAFGLAVPGTHRSPRAALPGARAGAPALRRFPYREALASIRTVEPTRLKALLESVQGVRDAVSDLERELVAALADHRTETAPLNRPPPTRSG